MFADRDKRALHRIVMKNKESVSEKMTAELHTVLIKSLLAPKQYEGNSMCLWASCHSKAPLFERCFHTFAHICTSTHIASFLSIVFLTFHDKFSSLF